MNGYPYVAISELLNLGSGSFASVNSTRNICCFMSTISYERNSVARSISTKYQCSWVFTSFATYLPIFLLTVIFEFYETLIRTLCIILKLPNKYRLHWYNSREHQRGQAVTNSTLIRKWSLRRSIVKRITIARTLRIHKSHAEIGNSTWTRWGVKSWKESPAVIRVNPFSPCIRNKSSHSPNSFHA